MPAQPAFTTDVERVAKVLREVEGCPQGARNLLADGLAKAVGQQPDEERHDFQQRFLTAATHVLSSAEQDAATKITSAGESKRKAETELENQRDACAKAAKVEADAQAETDNKAKLVEEVKQKVVDAERQHKEIEQLKIQVCNERNEIKQQKAQHSSVADGSLRMLLEGGWTDEEMKGQVIDAVCTHLASGKADEALIIAAKAALGTKPESRHEFDVVTTACVQEVFKAETEKLERLLAEGEADEAEKTAHALGMWAIADVARDACKAAETDAEACSEAFTTAAATSKDAGKKAKQMEKSLATIEKQCGGAAGLHQEIADAIAAFARLDANQYEKQTEAADMVVDSSAAKQDVQTISNKVVESAETDMAASPLVGGA